MIPAITSHQITTDYELNTLSSNDEMRKRKNLKNKIFSRWCTYRGASEGANEGANEIIPLQSFNNYRGVSEGANEIIPLQSFNNYRGASEGANEIIPLQSFNNYREASEGVMELSLSRVLIIIEG